MSMQPWPGAYLISMSVHVSALLDEEPYDVHVATQSCHPQRILVISVHIRAVLEEELNNVCVAIV